MSSPHPLGWAPGHRLGDRQGGRPAQKPQPCPSYCVSHDGWLHTKRLRGKAGWEGGGHTGRGTLGDEGGRGREAKHRLHPRSGKVSGCKGIPELIAGRLTGSGQLTMTGDRPLLGGGVEEGRGWGWFGTEPRSAPCGSVTPSRCGGITAGHSFNPEQDWIPEAIPGAPCQEGNLKGAWHYSNLGRAGPALQGVPDLHLLVHSK